jgi:hypothetical protein
MGLDQTRQHDHALTVDGGRPLHIELWSDRDDCAVAHLHVTSSDVAGVALHGHNKGVADDEMSALRQALGGRRQRLTRCGKRRERSSAAQNAAAAEVMSDHGCLSEFTSCIPAVSI